MTQRQEEIARLAAAGKAGKLDQIKAAAGGAGQSCKACHDACQRPANRPCWVRD